jgi:signal transduction histidine kinase
MSVWVFLLGFASIWAVAYVVKTQMRQNMEKQITEEMEGVQSNSELYVRQTLMINNASIDEEGFEQCAYEIEHQLKRAGYTDIALYNTEGDLLRSSARERFAGTNRREDFQFAKRSRSALTLCYGKQNQCDVYFSMPVQVMGQQVGILSCYQDYSALYKREWEIIGGMLRVTVLAFGVIYLAIWLMIRRMIRPVRQLGRISGEISDHLKDGQFDSIIMEKPGVIRRKDEIGELSRNYMQMVRVIEEQFEKIQEDRDHILQLWNSRQEFYNNVTHELKTPLTTISGYAQLIEENGLEDEELFYSGMEHILQESTRLHRMVIQLLEMQDKGRYTRMEQIDAAVVLRSVVDAMQMKAKRYMNRLMIQEEPGDYLIEGREDRIRQVLINLIDNAIKYGKTGEDIWIRFVKRDAMVQIAVANQGRGMDKDELSHIFEPFYRVDKERSREMGSSGLGLAISKKIMEEHHGTIQAESEPGGYTLFMVCFPEVKEQ